MIDNPPVDHPHNTFHFINLSPQLWMCVSSAAELQQHTESILLKAETRNAVVSFNRHRMILRLSVGVDHEVAGEPRGRKLWANGPVARIRCGQAVGSGRTMKTAVAITR